MLRNILLFLFIILLVLPVIAQLPTVLSIPGGTFSMGSRGGDADEKPVHAVTINPFYLAKTETTFAQFKAFAAASGYITDAELGDGSFVWDSLGWHKQEQVNWRHDERGRWRSRTPGDFGNYPVLHVSWYDAAHYCNWLSKQSGLQQVYDFQENTLKTIFSANGYRLPGEAEWEYAAAGGQIQPFAGSGSLDALAWYSGNSRHHVHAVAGKKANEAGLYDLTGNLWEWCHDWYDPRFYAGSREATDPYGLPIGQERALRGGSWNNNRTHCRIANRSSRYPDFRDGSVGFRVARR